jgi:hypothetical protein
MAHIAALVPPAAAVPTGCDAAERLISFRARSPAIPPPNEDRIMPVDGEHNEELAYALITPYSLHKSRTGGIIARLLWANVRLVAARMYAPQPEGDFLREYCDVIYDPDEEDVSLHYQRTLIQYIMENFGRPNIRGISNRMLVLVFKGPNARRELVNATGHISQDVRGDNVRGTFGDYITEDTSKPYFQAARERTQAAMEDCYPALKGVDTGLEEHRFFEPGVLTGVTSRMTAEHLRLFRRRAYTDGGFVLEALDGVETSALETSMVILKPESFRRRNPLPGNLIDFFARTGMFITGTKIVQLTVDQAREFYAAKLPQFRRELKGMVEEKAREIVERARCLAEATGPTFGVEQDQLQDPAKAIPLAREAEYLFAAPAESEPGEVKENVLDELYDVLSERLDTLQPEDCFYAEVAEELKDLNARAEFNELIRYMSGADPETGHPIEDYGKTTCMALLYSGQNGLEVIRRRLKELRKVYGTNVLQNRAHASDPEEDPVAETRVLGMPNAPCGESRPCDLVKVVNDAFEGE